MKVSLLRGIYMEHNSFNNLVEILKSQVIHYTDIRDTLSRERTAVTSWDTNTMFELNKHKEQLVKKEKLLEEARKTLSQRLMQEHNLEDDTISSIIEVCDDEKAREDLTNLRDNLLVLVSEISQITVSLKVLYNTNLKIMNDVKVRMGYLPSNKYGLDNKSSSSLPSSLQVIG